MGTNTILRTNSLAPGQSLNVTSSCPGTVLQYWHQHAPTCAPYYSVQFILNAARDREQPDGARFTRCRALGLRSPVLENSALISKQIATYAV